MQSFNVFMFNIDFNLPDMPQIIWRSYGIWFAYCLSFQGADRQLIRRHIPASRRSLLIPAFQRSGYLTSGCRLLLTEVSPRRWTLLLRPQWVYRKPERKVYHYSSTKKVVIILPNAQSRGPKKGADFVAPTRLSHRLLDPSTTHVGIFSPQIFYCPIKSAAFDTGR